MADAVAGRGRRLDAVLLAGAFLVLLQTVVRALIVFPSYFSQDDFVHMHLARQLGLSRDFLVRDHNGHLEIGPNLVYWLIGRDMGLSFAPAALCLIGMQVVASLLLLAVLRTLFGRSPWLLVPFAGYLFTPLGLPVATWWAAGFEAMPLQIAMLTTLLGLVRALRQRSWRWAAVSVAGHALGLLFYEKAVLVLPAVLGVILLVEWAGDPVGRRLRRLAGAWRYLVPHVLLLAAYLPLYASVVDSRATLDVRAGTVVSTTGETVSRLLLPGLLGGPWTDVGHENTVFADVGGRVAAFAAVVCLAVIATSVWLRGARALQAWLLVAGYLAVDLALVQIGRAEFLDLVARDPRYITDALPIIAIGVCAAFSGPVVQRRGIRGVRRVARSTGAALAATALLAASGIFSSSVVAEELQHRNSRDYVHGVLRAMDADPDVLFLNTGLPFGINLFTEPADLRSLLRVLGEERRFDQPGTDARIFDGQAVPRPVTLVAPSLEAAGPLPGCGWSPAAEQQRLGDLAAAAPGPQVLRLGYAAGPGTTLHVAVGEAEQELALPAGAGQAFFVVTGQQGPVRVRVTGAAPGTVCVDGLTVGTPWPEGVT